MANTANTVKAMTSSEGPRFAELKRRLLFLVGALIVYRIGTFVPVPGINPDAVARMFDTGQTNFFDMANMFSGGALERLSIFALGVMPYISASIIIQMLSHVLPSLIELRKEGESGRRKITKYTRYATVCLAAFQSIATASALQSQPDVVYNPGPYFVFTAAVTLTTGTMFLMWLGEQISERGIGNGISIIILAGIIAGLPAAIGGTLVNVSSGQMSPILAIALLALVLGVTYFVVYMERGQRRIAVNYAKRQQGRKMVQGQSTHLPFKINMSGVIPPIFASSIILLPTTIAGWFSQNNDDLGWLQNIAQTLGPGQPVYMILYASLIFFFCFFYTALVFNSRDTADNLKKSGAFVPGIRPGKATGEYIDTVLTRLTFWGAIYVAAVCLLPELLVYKFSIPFYFGGTSLLIIVVVVMDFMSQMQAHVMSQQYEGLMKKANLKGYGRSGSPR